ncbi:hypothetical protein LCM10_10070 [Rossellomorea aquimaris]|uniref:hypothetical protein n=1 Tax=Rossellomorea aquimaris TaxID=189382 RepID=UPI001CD73F38|nr:hypothetical protein [Rossellomorea aquimaris]MCA1055330.1 hypothetical protein [Rossellomorea aquimaris]
MNQPWYNIGAFTFPGSWAALVMAFIITFIALFFWNKKASDWYSNAVFYFILIWKLSVIVVDFGTVIKHPLTILYFNGGITGYWLGIAAILVYTLVKKVNPHHAIVAWFLTVLVYEGVFDILLGKYMIGPAQLIVNGILLFFLLKKMKDAGGEVWVPQLLIMFTLFQMLMNSFGGFSMNTPMLTYILVAVVLLLLMKMPTETDRQGGITSE